MKLPTLVTSKNARSYPKHINIVTFKFNGFKNSKLHQYPSPIMGNGYKWGVGALNDEWIRSYTIHQKKFSEHIVASPNINTMSKIKYKSIKPENDTAFYEHVIQGLHVVLGKTLPTFICLSTPIRSNHLPILTTWPMHAPITPLKC